MASLTTRTNPKTASGRLEGLLHDARSLKASSLPGSTGTAGAWRRSAKVAAASSRLAKSKAAGPAPDVRSSAFDEVMLHLETLNRSLEELCSNLANTQAVTIHDDRLSKALAEHLVDYRDRWPDVEVTVEILEIGGLKIAPMTFEATVRVVLDWEESELLEGVHYYVDLKGRGPVILDEVLEDERSFNPHIVIENAVDVETVRRDVRPKVQRAVRRTGLDGDRVESLWLTKEYIFKGTLKCPHLEARYFPFDIHRLPIHIKSQALPGVTTLGGPRIVRLLDPKLRRYERLQRLKRKQAGSHLTAMEPLLPHEFADQSLEAEAPHHWRMLERKVHSEHSGEKSSLLLTVGELTVCAFGGACHDPPGNLYHLEVIVVRNWTRYFQEILVRILLVVISALSVYVPFTASQLTNRLTVTLTVILTLVVSNRPPAIEQVADTTLFDLFSRGTFFLSVAMAFENFLVFSQCYGTYREGLDDNFLGVGTLFGPNTRLCDWSFCRSTQFDCIIFVVVMSLVGAFPFCLMVYAQLGQMRCLLRAGRKFGLAGGLTDRVGGERRNRLMLRRRLLRGQRHVHFDSLYEEKDMVGVLSSTLPLLAVAPRFWLWCAGPRHPRRWSCLLRLRCRCRRLQIWPAPADTDDVQVRSTVGASSRAGDWVERRFGRWAIIDPEEVTHIVDVGTGEVGFYQFSQHGLGEGTRPLLFMATGPKLSVAAGQDFLEEFVQRPDGAERFATHLVERFGPSVEEQPTGHDSQGFSQVSHSISVVRSTFLGNARRRTKILLGPTGRVRRMLQENAECAEEVEAWTSRVREQLHFRGLSADLLVFVPTEQDEATYELLAAEWLVQHGDLDVMRCERGSNQELFAGFELNQAFMRARAEGALTVAREGFLREFRDLVSGALNTQFLAWKFQQATELSGADPGFADLQVLCEVFRDSPALMRALVKQRLFNGVISAGGGSCQVAVKPDQERVLARKRAVGNLDHLNTEHVGGKGNMLRSSEIFALPLGNKHPLTTEGGRSAMWSSSACISTAMVADWRQRINNLWQSMLSQGHVPDKMDRGLRGLYIGIAAVYHAAELAQCAEVVLPKAVFLDKLSGKLQELLGASDTAQPGEDGAALYDHRKVSNLVLVHELVDKVLAETAWIVCKRKWQAQPASLETSLAHVDTEVMETNSSSTSLESPKLDGAGEAPLPEYVATWVLGFYLHQTRLL